VNGASVLLLVKRSALSNSGTTAVAWPSSTEEEIETHSGPARAALGVTLSCLLRSPLNTRLSQGGGEFRRRLG
jgi:hypothetical protein